MKIAFVMNTLERTGGHRTVLEYCNGLKKLGHEVLLVGLGRRAHLRWFQMQAPLTLSQHGWFLDFYNKRADYVPGLPRSDMVHQLSKLIPDCDVAVATYFVTATAVWRALRPRTRAYFAQHFEQYLFPGDSFESRWATETYFLPMPKVANSQWLGARLLELTGTSVPVVNPGLNLSTFYPRKVPRGGNRKRIVALAKDTVWKGYSDLMAALRILERSENDLEVVTYGAWSPPPVKSRTHQIHVSRPSDNELARLYSSADVVVCPSWFESFPLPPLEAMACGAPVVTTRFGTEDYAVDLVNALVVPPRSPEALAQAILRVLRDESLGREISRRAIETAGRFTWQRAWVSMESFLNQVTSEG